MADRRCSICGTEMNDAARTCPNCGAIFPPAVGASSESVPPRAPASPPAPALATPTPAAVPLGRPAHAKEAPQRVTVIDVDMPIGSMVIFMIKWAIAAIPALFILIALTFGISALLAGAIGGLALWSPRASVPQAASASTGNGSHDRLMDLSESGRASWLAAIVISSGDECNGANRPFFQGFDDESKEAFWNVTCDGGKRYAVALHPDASKPNRHVECDLMQRINVPCYTKIGE